MYLGIILTILTGLFFLIGIIMVNCFKNKEKVSLITTSLAFVVLIGLLFLDLLPELLENKDIQLLMPMIVGFSMLIVLDKLVPHHHHDHVHCDKHDHEEHLQHIGKITIIALTIHNLVEGITLYSLSLNNIKGAILMMISISLHNIPLGFQIGNSINNKKDNLFSIILLCSSSFLGALIVIFYGAINQILSSILLSLTFGMLLYLLIFELFNEIKASFKKKEVIYGIIIGVVILLITYLV